MSTISDEVREDAQYAKFAGHFRKSHFTKTLEGLLKDGPASVTRLFGNRLETNQDTVTTAHVIKAHLGKVSHEKAKGKHGRLKKALQSIVPNDKTLNKLIEFSSKFLLPKLLQDVALLNPQEAADVLDMGAGVTHKSDFHSLVVGLNALLVAELQTSAKHATFQLNHFAAIDPSSLPNFLGQKYNATRASQLVPYPDDIGRRLDDVPSSVNWVFEDMVGPVQNQGACGCCWSFVATAVLQSRLAISGAGSVNVLSQQQLLSCNLNGEGCDGGAYVDSWKSAASTGGVVLDVSYPYINGKQGLALSCDDSKTADKVVLPSSLTYGMTSETQMMSAVASGGPVGISISAPPCFQFYKSGVLTDEDCPCYSGTDSINHAVTLVGYGMDPITKQPYWLAQNSWGTNWGQQGYIQMQRFAASPGMCGLLLEPAFPSSVQLTSDCSGSNPPAYCQPIQPVYYTNTNGTGVLANMCVRNNAGMFIDSLCSTPLINTNQTTNATGNSFPGWGWIVFSVGSVLLIAALLFKVAMMYRASRRQPRDSVTSWGSNPPSEMTSKQRDMTSVSLSRLEYM